MGQPFPRYFDYPSKPIYYIDDDDDFDDYDIGGSGFSYNSGPKIEIDKPKEDDGEKQEEEKSGKSETDQVGEEPENKNPNNPHAEGGEVEGPTEEEHREDDRPPAADEDESWE